MKANSNLSLVKALVRHGSGLDIVSGGELYKALKVKADPKKIVYASVGKTPEEIAKAIKIGILFFNVESIPELLLINKIARRLKRKSGVCIRINPDVEPQTHKLITTGKLTNKFGIDFDTAKTIFLARHTFDWVDIKGLHIHIGSQIIKSRPFISAIKKVLSFIDELKNEGIRISYFNIGGGLGIIYNKEHPQTANEFAEAILPLLKKRNLKFILEPGRFIVGNAGVLVTKIIYVKESRLKNFCIVDAAMNDLIRPALYEAYHEILPLKQPVSAKKYKYDVVGPVCESADFFAKDRWFNELKPADLLAVMSVGAYGYVMSSNYNARRRIPEIVVKGSKFYVARKRETYRDLIRGEQIIPDLR
jgi:diaminopimelate decarboxylase